MRRWTRTALTTACLLASTQAWGQGTESCDLPDAEVVTESLDQSVIPANSVSCNGGGVTADNRYYRRFDLAANGITGAIDIVAVEVGIELSDPAFGFDTQPVSILIYRDTTPGDPAPLADLVELHEQAYALPEINTGSGGLQCFELATSVSVAPSALELVVAFDIPDAYSNFIGHVIFVGSNDLGEESLSYLSTEACGLPEPVSLDELGFPWMDVVMNVYFERAPLLRGDADGSGAFSIIIDALYILAHQFQGGPAPPCMESADADGDGTFSGLADGVYLLAHGFQGGPPPPAPHPDCGLDPDPGTSLGCESHPGCP